MSGIPELLTLGVGLDTSSAEAALANLGGTGAEEAVAGLESKLNGASDGLAELGKRSSGASRGIQGLASVVSLVDPRLGQVIRSVGTLARGMSVLRLGLGPAAVAVAAVTAALALYQRQQEELAEQERRSIAVADAMRGVREQLKDATLDLSVEVGTLTQNERELLEIRQRAFTENLPAVKEFTSQIAGQSREVELARNRMETFKNEVEGAGIRFKKGEINARELSFITSNLGGSVAEAAVAYQKERTALEALQGNYTIFLGDLRETIETRKQALKVSEDNEQRQRIEAESLAERTRGLQEYANMLKEVSDIERDASRAVLSEEQRLVATYQERMEQLERISQQSQGNIDTTNAEAALRTQLEEDYGAVQARRHEERMANIAREEAAERQAALGQLQVATDITGSLASLAAQQFSNDQDAKVAQATTAAILAGINTIAQNPTPLGIVQAAANTALALSQVTAMRAVQVTAHRGSFGDEVPAMYRRGEAVLNPQGRAAFGDDVLRRANAGMSPGGQIIEVRQFYRHRSYDVFARDNLNRGGPLSSAISDGRDGGYHRGDRNGA